MNKECPFCHPVQIIISNDLAYAIYDRYPVSEGHLLIIPFRHVADYWLSTPLERQAINDLLESGKIYLDEHFNPDAYNIV